MLCTGGMTEVYRYISFMAYTIDNMCSRLARYIDGLMQKRRNSSTLSRRYGVSFNLTRWAPTSGEILSAILNNITSLLIIHSKSLIARETLTRMPNFVSVLCMSMEKALSDQHVDSCDRHRAMTKVITGHLFTKRYDVLPPKFRSREIGYYNYRIALTFDSHLTSAPVVVPIKLQSDLKV